MALDGITTAAILHEMKSILIGGRIDKIHQPVSDEIRFSVRTTGGNYKVLASANSGHPRLHITEHTRENPMTAPLFCMVLRKHIAGGKIVNLSQPNFERILVIDIESANEMGDLTTKHLILEIMGKHSNLILTDENNKILDAIKRVSHDKSSVREVLPGKTYVLPPSQEKQDPTQLNQTQFFSFLQVQPGQKIQNFLYQSYTGISPIMAAEICHRAQIDPSNACVQLTQTQAEQLYTTFAAVMQDVAMAQYTPAIYYQKAGGKIIDFGVLPMTQFDTLYKKTFSSISAVLEAFYTERDNAAHIKQRAHDTRRLILTNIERCVKKKEIQQKTLRDIANREVWKRKGELITANIYAIAPQSSVFRTADFYEPDLPEIEIALDPTKTPAENAQKYFQKYNKAKRTLAAMQIQQKQNDEELAYLESVLQALDTIKDEADLAEIRTELAESGFIRRTAPKKGQAKPKKAKPMRFISSDGYEILVGKSNLQNDTLTLKTAEPTDIWLHTKEIPGSHVIIRTQGQNEVPIPTLEEAANLAAYFSKAKNSSMVPVDYTQRKNVKKPNGAKPGMVIYLTNKTIYITPDEEKVNQMQTT